MAFHFPLMPRIYMAIPAGGPAADHGHHGADAGHSMELPMGNFSSES